MEPGTRLTQFLLNVQHLTAYTEEDNINAILIASHSGKPLPRKSFQELFLKISAWYDHHTDEDIQRIWDEIDEDRNREQVTENTRKALKPGVVYLIRCGAYYKIGKSQKFPQRRIQLETQLPEKSEVIATIACDDPQDYERMWHQAFADKRLNGEWFALTNEDVNHFCSHA